MSVKDINKTTNLEVEKFSFHIPTMVGIKDAARQTGLSYDYIRKLCLTGRIVHVRAGVKFLINLEKLAEFLEQGEQGNGQ